MGKNGLGNVLKLLDNVIPGCVAVQRHDISSVFVLSYMTHNVVYNVSSQLISKLVYSSLSFPTVDVVVRTVHRLIGRVYELLFG